jgi:hypothetical protein
MYRRPLSTKEMLSMWPFSSRKARPRTQNRPRRSPYRPRLELLEDRTAPAVLTVTSPFDDNGAGTLRAVLTTANTDAANGQSDTIVFDASLTGATIALTQGQLVLSGASATAKITIDGSDLSSPVTISGQGASRVFRVGRGVRVEFDSLTITGGRIVDGSGGGIANGGDLLVCGCTLSGNSADTGGGGIDNSSFSTLTVTNSTLSGNAGAGIFSDYGGTPTISGCTISGNSGNGISNNAGRLTVTDCTVSGNGLSGIWSSSGDRGTLIVSGSTLSRNTQWGILNNGPGTVSGCTISGNALDGISNSATTYFGFLGETLTVSGCTITGNGVLGLYNNGTETVSGCTISGNLAAGIWNDSFSFWEFGVGSVPGGAMTVSGCTISGNGNDRTLPVVGEGGIINGGTLAVSGCTISGNSAWNSGGGIVNGGTLTVSNSTLSGNVARTGGGIYNFGTLIGSGCTISGNSAAVAGGGIANDRVANYNGDGSVNGYVTGDLSIDNHSAVCDNQAGSGADLENLGTLSISHSAVARVDNQNPGATTIDNAATDTATALTASGQQGQVVFTVKVLAAQTGMALPSGAVTLYDGNNSQLGQPATLDATGQATFTDPAILGSPAPIHAVYANDGSSNFSPSTSAALIQTADALTPGDLQTVVNSLAASNATAVALQVNPNADASLQDASWQAALAAINAVTAPVVNGAPVPVTVVLNVAPGTYSDMTYSNSDPNVSFILNGSPVLGGTVVNGHSPALQVTAGRVTVLNVTFTTATDSPTILVTGGRLTLRNDVVQESTGYSDAAIALSGGSTVDLGTAASPGGNTVQVNGAGQVLASTGLNFVLTAGDTYLVNGAAVAPFATLALASSVNPSLLNQPVTFTATVAAPDETSASPTGSVTFVDRTTGATLGVVPLSAGSARLTVSALPVNAQAVAAVYSGDAHYTTDAATLVQTVRYRFSGFLAPLNATAALGLGRTVPIKFQLTDYNGTFVSDLGAVTSLKVFDPQGNDVLAGAGKTGLRYDPTAHQFVDNWQTKGLAAGSYTVQLLLADGTTKSQAVQLAASSGSAKVEVEGSGGGTASAGGLLGGDIALYVDNGNGDLTADERARIDDAVASVDATLAPYGVTITEVSDPAAANVTLHMDTTSAVGGYADGVLGCTTDGGAITLIAGWDWYAGSDAGAIGAGQYDFETVVEHELGHALGLGHSSDATSVMYATLASGTVRRALAAADLNVPDTDEGACGLHVELLPSAVMGSNDPPMGVRNASAEPRGEAWLTVGPGASLTRVPVADNNGLSVWPFDGYVHATDLVYAGGLLAYDGAGTITGLTSGGFIDVQDLMNAANAVLGLVQPGTPSGSDPNTAHEAALTQVLQAVNGNTDFVSQEVLWNLLGF